ncbi:FISUMP domain-containing protein [Elizabethkingia ursingii]|uniref:Fibrobacter succinogenes major paralogous domain-containing protein n=1 Tax=Elizabethkingia ursingii TaxID=1756150 RepID=A0ABX3N8F3_9FLAO|nr:FISUMP domain-containing protein [Elizabethkingia ursingii]OPB88868.1 hypothetical protein BB021_05720 [Elizabethkingia ursingii]
MIKNILRHIKLIITINILVFVCVGIISCRNTNDILESNKGEATVKIALKGSDFEDSKILGSQAGIKGIGIQSRNEQKEEISFKGNDDYKLVATLTPVNNTDALAQVSSKVNSVAATKTNPLDSGIKYKVVVYDSNGKYIKEQDYTSGQSGSDITGLNGGETYTFIVYSVGSKTDLPAVTYSDSTNKTLSTAILDNVSGDNDLMYFSKIMEVSGDSVNYLDITLKHKFSQITTILDTSLANTSDSKSNYIITGIDGVTIAPHSNNAKIQLLDGNTTVTSSSVEKSVSFPMLNSTTVTSSTVLINSSDVTNGVLNIKSITMKADEAFITHENITFNNLKITRGVQYNLKLSFAPNDKYLIYRGYPAVRINGFIWMRHNLGVDVSLDPDKPSQALFGNYYQFGRNTVVADAYSSSGAISGWNKNMAPNNAWNSGTEINPIKTAQDPCPSGWRVPTYAEMWVLWLNTNYASDPEFLGDVKNMSSTNYNAGIVLKSIHNPAIKVTIPFTGSRNYNDGSLGTDYNNTNKITNGRGVNGNLWVTTKANTNPSVYSFFGTKAYTSDQSWSYLLAISAKDTNGTDTRNQANPIRCIAQAPLAPPYN